MKTFTTAHTSFVLSKRNTCCSFSFRPVVVEPPTGERLTWQYYLQDIYSAELKDKVLTLEGNTFIAQLGTSDGDTGSYTIYRTSPAHSVDFNGELDSTYPPELSITQPIIMTFEKIEGVLHWSYSGGMANE